MFMRLLEVLSFPSFLLYMVFSRIKDIFSFVIVIVIAIVIVIVIVRSQGSL